VKILQIITIIIYCRETEFHLKHNRLNNCTGGSNINGRLTPSIGANATCNSKAIKSSRQAQLTLKSMCGIRTSPRPPGNRGGKNG